MKRLPFFLMMSIAVAAVAALVLHLVSDKRRLNVPRGTGYLGLGDESQAAKTFKGFNFNLLLNANTHDGEAELTALQHLINAYYGTAAIAITGKWDAATEAAVKDITGLSGVSLYQFRYYYFVQVRGDQAAIDIINNLTEK